MTILNILFRTATAEAASVLRARTQIGYATVDVALEVNHTREAQVTEFPVEAGGVITDHAILRPKRLSISGLVTDTPLADGVGSLLGSARSSATFGILEALWEARNPFIVYAPRQLYLSMLIERLYVPESKEGSLRFQCDMVEIVTVFAQNVTIPPTAETSTAVKGVPNATSTASGGGVSALTPGNVSNPEALSNTIDVGRVAPSQTPKSLLAQIADFGL